MNKSRLQRIVLVLAVAIAAAVALYQVDLLSVLKQLHSMQWPSERPAC